MASDTFEELLNRAAALRGIEPGFWDIFGRYHPTTIAGKQAILRAMGWASGSVTELEQSLAAQARREWERLAPLTVVALEGEKLELSLNLLAEKLGEPATMTVRPEDGSTQVLELQAGALTQTGSIVIEGQTRVRVLAGTAIQLPLGYHEIAVQSGTAKSVTRYIVAPRRAWSQPHLASGGRAAGLAISLYGLRSTRNWGCGDFRDLQDLIDWAPDALRASFIALNPLHAIHNRRPFNTSPYLPNCIFYQNFIYLDIEGMEDYAACRRARQLRESDEVGREIEELRGAEFVEYERVSALKLRFLKLAFVQFLRERRRGTARSREFDEFCAREGELLKRCALYCALDEWLHRRNPNLWLWPDWPPEYHDPESPETRAFAGKHWRSVMFYQYLQWQIDLQLRAAQARAQDRRMSIGLYHDLALATDQFGSDLWAHRPFFISGCSVGAPPDDFAPQGQDWGFPPPNSQQHFEDGYRLFADSIRRNCRHGGALRIDHVMRLFRLYWIPAGCDATQGAYVQELSEDFVRILALESVRNQVMVIGEDLGTVEPKVRETLAWFGILSYRLFYFEKNKSGGFRAAGEYPQQALVSSTTHDLPTLAGFWIGADIESRRKAGAIDDEAHREQWELRTNEKQKMLDRLFEEGLLRADLPRQAAAYPELTGDLHHAAIGFLARTPAQLLAVNQEDLTKETAQQNLPGTTWQYPNWGRKMRYSVEDLSAREEARGFTAMVRYWVVKSGREDSGLEAKSVTGEGKG
jgi:4-alpha-glucanotransferase